MHNTLLNHPVLLARASTSPSATTNIFGIIRNQALAAVYPETTAGFRSRYIGFAAMSAFSAFSCLVYLVLLWQREEKGVRPNFWVWRTVDRMGRRVVLLNLRMWIVIGGILSSVCMLSYDISFGQTYLQHQSQSALSRWRAFMWLPLVFQGYFISVSSLQAFLLCLSDLQLFSTPRLASWAYNGVASLLAVGGIVTGALMATTGTKVWKTADELLDMLAALAASTTPVTAQQLAALNVRTALLDRQTIAYRRFALAQFSFCAVILVFILLVNAAGAVLCVLMAGRVAEAEARLTGVGPCLSVELAESSSSSGVEDGDVYRGEVRGAAGAGRLTKKELEHLARPAKDKQDQEADGTVKERAHAVLAMKKALFDLRVVTTVVCFCCTVGLGFVVYIIVYTANDWFLSKPFSYNEAATLGLLWAQLVVTTGSVVILSFNEWRYRRTWATSGATTAVQSPHEGVLQKV